MKAGQQRSTSSRRVLRRELEFRRRKREREREGRERRERQGGWIEGWEGGNELAQQIGINGDKLSWPVIDEAHRPWRQVTVACTTFSLPSPLAYPPPRYSAPVVSFYNGIRSRIYLVVPPLSIAPTTACEFTRSPTNRPVSRIRLSFETMKKSVRGAIFRSRTDTNRTMRCCYT